MKLHIYVCSTDSTKVCIFKKKKHCFVLVLVFLRHFVLFICSRLKTATAVSTLDTICTFYCVLEIVVIYIELPLGLSNFSFPVPLYFDLPKLHGTYPCLRIWLICRFIVKKNNAKKYNNNIGQNTGTSNILNIAKKIEIETAFVAESLWKKTNTKNETKTKKQNVGNCCVRLTVLRDER